MKSGLFFLSGQFQDNFFAAELSGDMEVYTFKVLRITGNYLMYEIINYGRYISRIDEFTLNVNINGVP